MTPRCVGTPIAPDILERLKGAAGPGGALEDPADTAPYCKSFRDGWVGRVPLVLRPQTTAAVADVVRICAEAGIGVVPQGGNTGLTGGSQPHADMSEIILSTSRLNQIRAIDTVNDTIVAEAGVVLKAIQSAAERVDRLFPLSLGAEGSCQIGGNISTNAGGVQVLRYGNMRNLVLGLEVVLPDGGVWNGLRALRKDNAGYDLKQIFIGAEGTLGIVTAAVLRLLPKPTASETAWIGLASPAAAVALLGHMRARLGDTISAFELIGRSAIDLLLAGVPGHEDPMSQVHPWYVLMELTSQGAAGSLSAPLTDALAAALEGDLIGDALLAASGAQATKLWRMRESLVEAQQAAGGSIAHDVSVPVSRIADFIARADAALAAACPGMRHCAFGHVGDGNIHYNPVRPLDWDAGRLRQERPHINRIVHDIVAELGGSISAEHGVGQSRVEELERYKQPVELDMMRSLKRALDPHGIMNPGKLLVR
ncbi:MAG TPA: FAD-binding oxidoreductase [Hyphomicrobiaceae bacterium]|nr:FAD-binding oxidoreductase [Hyphomicrobiaceae bacterium]